MGAILDKRLRAHSRGGDRRLSPSRAGDVWPTPPRPGGTIQGLMNQALVVLARVGVIAFPLVCVFWPLAASVHSGHVQPLLDAVWRWHWVFLALSCWVAGGALKRSNPAVWWLCVLGCVWLLQPYAEAALAGHWPLMAWLRQGVLPWLLVTFVLLWQRGLRPFL